MVFFYVLALKVDVLEPVSTGFNFICHRGGYIIDNSPPLTINIEKDKVSLEIPSDTMRRQMLTEMGKLYNIDFSVNEKSHFSETGIVNVPLSSFKNRVFDHYLDQSNENTKGIECSTDKSELYNWVKQARVADVVINQKALVIDVKVDDQSEPRLIKRVQAVLHEQHINKFHLITSQKDSLASPLNDDYHPL